MDASQYKDYVLVLLFVKYLSDKYAGQKDALLDVPPGGYVKVGGRYGHETLGFSLRESSWKLNTEEMSPTDHE